MGNFSSTLVWIGGAVAVVGVGYYLYTNNYFDSIIATITNALPKPSTDTGKDDKDDKEDDKSKDEGKDEEEEKETPKCKSGQTYDEKKKKCVKSSKLAIAYMGQQGPFRAYKTFYV